MPVACGLTTGLREDEPAEREPSSDPGGGRRGFSHGERPAAVRHSGAGPGPDTQLGGPLAEERLPRSRPASFRKRGFAGVLVWRRHHPGLKTRCPPHPPGVLVRGEDAGRPEEEVTRRPRQRRTACPRVRDTRGGGSRREPGERREMAALWPSAGRATLRDGPPRPASGLPSRGRERFRRLEPPRCGGLSRQPHDLQAGCQGGAGPGRWMSRGHGAGGTAGRVTDRCLCCCHPSGCEEGSPWKPVGGNREGSSLLRRVGRDRGPVAAAASPACSDPAPRPTASWGCSSRPRLPPRAPQRGRRGLWSPSSPVWGVPSIVVASATRRTGPGAEVAGRGWSGPRAGRRGFLKEAKLRVCSVFRPPGGTGTPIHLV